MTDNTPGQVPEALDDLYLKLHGLSKHLESSGRIDESDAPEAYPAILDAMNLVRRLQSEAAQVPATTAQPVQDYAELLESDEHIGTEERNEIAAELRRLHAQVAALTAQPAAPQGVAYAELPTPESYLFQHDETGLTQFVDAQQVEWGFQQKNPRLRRIGGAYTADQMRDFADRTHALRASHGQAPAGAVGWVHPDWRAEHGQGHIYGHNPGGYVALTPTAQTAPAADPAYSEACSLATALFEKHYRQEPDYASGRVVWSLCDTTAGVISQIDNMVSGLARAPAAGAVAGMPPGISALMCVISSLRDTAHFSDEEGELTDELRTLRDWAMTLAAAPTPAAQADSVLEDAAREAIEKVLALFPFNVSIQKFTINNGPCLTADNDDEFYSVKRVLAFLTEIKTTLDAARKQGGKHD